MWYKYANKLNAINNADKYRNNLKILVNITWSAIKHYTFYLCV